MDKDKRDLAKAKTVYETGEIITTKVYKVSPEQKEGLDRLSVERLERLREEAIPKIRERYKQMIRSRQQHPKNDNVGQHPDN
ncbi:hypothetical protein [Paenibacillus cineris]|uniref:hypothetical protein n=1 Tax=Paenibacillus cineris TaxID=237530 RepID=UPI001BB3F057|nr:hypothetical protein [Paenibacillus cineris]